jgi:hypothetical protein
MSRPLTLASRAWLCPFDPGPLAITLTITMPDAWTNINATASSLTGSDPICGTCDIRATVRALRRMNVDPSIEASCRRRANICASIFDRAGRRACHSAFDEIAAALSRFEQAIVDAKQTGQSTARGRCPSHVTKI